jgi:hypothetical protein
MYHELNLLTIIIFCTISFLLSSNLNTLYHSIVAIITILRRCIKNYINFFCEKIFTTSFAQLTKHLYNTIEWFVFYIFHRKNEQYVLTTQSQLLSFTSQYFYVSLVIILFSYMLWYFFNCFTGDTHDGLLGLHDKYSTRGNIVDRSSSIILRHRVLL